MSTTKEEEGKSENWWSKGPDVDAKTEKVIDQALQQQQLEQQQNEPFKDESQPAAGGATSRGLMTASNIFLQDPIWERTYGRRVAMWLNQNVDWYGPQPLDSPNNENAPSLDKAWAFYEHVTLQRHVVDQQARGQPEEDGGNIFRQGERKLTLAEPGEMEQPTQLYPIFSTPLSQLGDFGLGFGIYFATIRDYAVLAFICGLLSIPNIIYFSSAEYSGTQDGVPTLLKGSAICTDRTWVPCPNCTQEEFDSSIRGAYEVKRFAQAWAVKPSEPAGFYLNVTDYLTWELNSTTKELDRTERGVVNLDRLINVSIPQEYNLELSATGGYILGEDNITRRIGYTPLWCGYAGPSDCYLDLYPTFYEKHDEGVTFENSNASFLAPVEHPGDTDFILIGFALRNNCDGATRDQGFINWGTLLIMILGSFYIRVRAHSIETKFDEDEQTAQDYSIVVKNPPPDAWDPEEWKQFFEGALRTEAGGKSNKGQEVRVCTVDVDNELMIQHIVQRREIRRQIEVLLPPDTPLDMESLEREVEKAEAEPSGCMSSPKIPPLVERLKEIESEIISFFVTATKPPTTKVYVTFETEAAQRTILSNMTVSSKASHDNDTSAVSPHYLFRGKHVLHIREAHEPNTIRWQDLNATKQSMMKRKIFTSVVTIGAMGFAYFVIRAIYKQNMNWLASIVTTVFTALFPMVAVSLMNLEKHHSESSRQAWLFAKVATFNIFVTTVLLSLITPFEATLDKKENSLPGLLPAIYSLFFSQLGLSPALQLLDIGGNLNRHIMAPRAKTQEEMNLLMRGTPVQLAERYGNLMKYIYMTLWYCSIYPAVFFMGSFAFIITYFVDRFSLMRSWARSPHVGAEISYFARQYFTPVGICLMSVMSAYYWSGFPYDNLCLVENGTLPSYYLGDFDINLEADSFTLFGSLSLYNVDAVHARFSIQDEAEVYKFCNQDIRSYPGLSFPALPQWQPEGGEWMTEEQEEIVSVHGWSSLVVLIVIIVSISKAIISEWQITYEARGEDQNIDFSDVPTIASYIPQVSSDLIAYPLLLCDIKDIDVHLFEWQDPEKPHSHYDVTRDVATVLGTTDFPHMFARVKHWPREARVWEEAEEQAAATTGSDPKQEGLVLWPSKSTDSKEQATKGRKKSSSLDLSCPSMTMNQPPSPTTTKTEQPSGGIKPESNALVLYPPKVEE